MLGYRVGPLVASQKGGWGVRRFVTLKIGLGPLRHIVAPQHIVWVKLDTRCSYAISECSKYITLWIT